MADASTTLPAPTEAMTRNGAREEAAPSAVSFPELVWAHFLRQQEVQETGNLHGPREGEYRRRLAAFEAAEGKLLKAYWCTSEASAVALTEKECRGFARIRRQPPDVRFHAATDWVARDSPEVANVLHTCETLAVRVREVLGGTSERIAMQWILAIAGHLLGFVDREDRTNRKDEQRLVARKRNELAKVEAYYHRAGEKLGRIIYFWGMMAGTLAVAAAGTAAAALLWWWTGLDPDDATTQNLFASYTMGAVGALVSVMTRMASSKSAFNLDFEVGRRQLRRLGSFRPAIGAVSALVVFFAMKGDLFQVLPDQTESFYLYAVVAFIAGFSERWANVIFGRAERLLGGEEEQEPRAQPGSKPVPEERIANV